MKVCSRCHIDKEDECFRVRKENRRGCCTYLNNNCIECERELKREYDKNVKLRPDYPAKHAAWNLKNYHKNRDKFIKKMKERRTTPEYKAYMKAYRERNKEKIREQEIITKKRYQEKNWSELSDVYVINQLVSQGVADKELLLQTPELIQLKRVQILIKRKIKTNVKN